LYLPVLKIYRPGEKFIPMQRSGIGKPGLPPDSLKQFRLFLYLPALML
jgi:hypothetical protein